jgi:hypothetical protein
VRTWPGSAWLKGWLTREKIPRADPQRFSILVANLENDSGRNYQRLIIEALKEFEGVQVLRLDRLIAVDGTDPKETAQRGHAAAQRFLKASGAELVL